MIEHRAVEYHGSKALSDIDRRRSVGTRTARGNVEAQAQNLTRAERNYNVEWARRCENVTHGRPARDCFTKVTSSMARILHNLVASTAYLAMERSLE